MWGQVQQVHCCIRDIFGHIHFEAGNSGGVAVATAESPIGDFIARQLHSASFKVVLPVPRTIEVSRIEIEFTARASG